VIRYYSAGLYRASTPEEIEEAFQVAASVEALRVEIRARQAQILDLIGVCEHTVCEDIRDQGRELRKCVRCGDTWRTD
jgi:hypothetical protein